MLYTYIPVLYQCWYLGAETGNAIVDVILDNYNPGAKLSVSIPKSVGYLPCYYNFKPMSVSVPEDIFNFRNKQPYNYEETNEPRFSFGYGLSYTQFEINASLEKIR